MFQDLKLSELMQKELNNQKVDSVSGFRARNAQMFSSKSISPNALIKDGNPELKRVFQ